MNYEHTSKLHRLRTLHLFAGAGGGILADILLGHQPVCAVEIEPYCQQVLHARQKDGFLPWFPIFDDVKTFDGKPWRGLVEVVAGGFPCVDISVAGKGAGIEGERSGLWGEMRRVISEIRPQYVFIENSPALAIRGGDRVIADLAELGFSARWGTFSAAECGAMHIRERIFILADSNPERDRLQRWVQQTEKRQRKITIRPDASLVENTNGHTRPRPEFHRRHNEIPNHVDRLRAIGNGQVPAVAALAWRILSEGII